MDTYLCDSCKKPTLGQRFCPSCGTIQKNAKIEGVAAATATPVKAPGAAAKSPAKGPGPKKGAAGATPPRPSASSLPKEKVVALFEKAITEIVDEQAMIFLRAFVVEFSGCFEEVLTLGEQLRTLHIACGSDMVLTKTRTDSSPLARRTCSSRCRRSTSFKASD